MQTICKPLRRSNTDIILSGVSGGLGSYLGISSTIVRLVWVLFGLAGGAGLAFYLLAWAIIPDENGRHTVMPLLLLALAILLPWMLVLLWIVPVTVTTTP